MTINLNVRVDLSTSEHLEDAAEALAHRIKLALLDEVQIERPLDREYIVGIVLDVEVTAR